MLVVVAGWTSTTKCKAAALLNRQQTEEWKGWMQVGAAADVGVAAAVLQAAIEFQPVIVVAVMPAGVDTAQNNGWC